MIPILQEKPLDTTPVVEKVHLVMTQAIPMLLGMTQMIPTTHSEKVQTLTPTTPMLLDTILMILMDAKVQLDMTLMLHQERVPTLTPTILMLPDMIPMQLDMIPMIPMDERVHLDMTP